MQILLPFESVLCPVCLEADRANYRALSLNDAIRHYSEKHTALEIIYICRLCEKPYKSKHGALCHIPKCPGKKTVTDALQCAECAEAFPTQRGLSQHKRHRHPNKRNEERTAQAQMEKADVPRIGISFTPEDILLMYQLERIYKGDPKITQKMTEHLKTKTLKQISDKRKEPAYCRRRDKYLVEMAKTLPAVKRRSVSLSSASGNVNKTPRDKITRRRGLSVTETDNSNKEIVDIELNDKETGMEPASAVSDTPLDCYRSESEMAENQCQDLTGNNGGHKTRLDITKIILKECRVNLSRCDHMVGTFGSDDEMENDLSESDSWQAGLVEALGKISYAKWPRHLTEIGRSLKEARNKLDIDSVETIYNKIVELLTKSQKSDSHDDRPPRGKHRTKRSHKRYLYARTQDLFKKEPGLLARHVRLGTDHTAQNNASIPRGEVIDLYTALWGSKVPTRVTDCNEAEAMGFDSFGPILAAEIQKRLTRTKKATAPGPDKIKKADLLGPYKCELLAGMFNLMLAAGALPSAWKNNRTTLIPKEGKDGTKVTNYRPLTIGSLLSRLFWGILDERLRSVIQMNPRQKGFVSEAGCYANVRILHELTHQMKKSGGGVGIQLDVSKAFDTVPHEAIPIALKRKGVPAPIVDLIRCSYEGAATTISHPEGEIKITLRRGVKQGDPLSPLLFNLVLEPLLERLEHMPGLPLPGESGISCLAFADDLFLFATDPSKAQDLLDCTVEELGSLGMTIAANKSCAYRIKSSKDSWFMEDPGVERIGEKIPVCTPENKITYLVLKAKTNAKSKTNSSVPNTAFPTSADHSRAL
ncbi:hypothetical protein PUN28_020686 [Cardiocondyla obscurior]|uniref:Reverse transcriptase n=1 Tax=Cardiocondyla obscurior TaxID=286306 RepID=A0AAW2E901_9HYME